MKQMPVDWQGGGGWGLKGRSERRQAQVPCVNGLKLFTGCGHRTLTNYFQYSAEKHKISGIDFPSLFKANCSVRSDLFMQHKAVLGQ